MSPKTLGRKKSVRVGLRSMLIIFSAPYLQSVGLVFLPFTTNPLGSHIKDFCLAMLYFHFLHFNSLSHIEACVQINWFVVFAFVFRSA